MGPTYGLAIDIPNFTSREVLTFKRFFFKAELKHLFHSLYKEELFSTIVTQQLLQNYIKQKNKILP